MESFVPAVLATTRDVRGMTQKELAHASRTAQSTVSKAESGQHRPEREIVEAWAEALRFPVDRFFAPISQVLPMVFYRKRASMRAGEVRRIEANLKLRASEIRTLLLAVDMPAVDVPEAAVSNAMDPASIARAVRERWQVPPGPIQDLSALLELHGVLVHEIDFGATRIDGLSIGDEHPMIFLRKGAPWDRLRFTLAHELGHLVLHHHLRGLPEEPEPEADMFAAEFLMPAANIKNLFSASLTLNDLARLKERWGVSMQALLMRAQSLARITEARSSRLWRELSRRGWRMQEPVAVDPEEPALVRELVRVHREELGYSVPQMASAVRLTADEFRELYCADDRGLRVVL